MGLSVLAVVLVALGGALLLLGRLVAPEGGGSPDGSRGGDVAKQKGPSAKAKPARQAAFATPSMLAAAAAEATSRDESGAPAAKRAPSAVAAGSPAAPASQGVVARALATTPAMPAAGLGPANSGERAAGGSQKLRADVLVEKVKAEFDKILRESQSGRRAADD